MDNNAHQQSGPEYYDEIKKAKKNGVKIFAYSCKINNKEISVNKKIKVKCLFLSFPLLKQELKLIQE